MMIAKQKSVFVIIEQILEAFRRVENGEIYNKVTYDLEVGPRVNLGNFILH